LLQYLQSAVTGEIPDARTVRATRAVVHPTVARWLIATVAAKNKFFQGALKATA